ncbi:MAG: MBL fold metallo-hydrolase [Spirosomataceae bacterium]
MKKLITLLSFNTLLMLLAYSSNAQLPPPDTLKTQKGDLIIQPIFHGALVMRWQQKTIYIDPYNGINAYKGLPSPDLILITHIHQDHMDTLTLNALNTAKANLIVPQAVADRLPSKWKNQEVVLSNDNTYTDSGISITAVPMYDLPQEANSRHIKGMGNGYVLEVGGKRIYVSGDTDDIPEMRNLKNIDVAFVCMNQPFTMTIQQAASAVLDFKPKIMYPYHYRDMNGFSDINTFKKLIDESNNSIVVRIRNWYAKM